MLRTLLASHLGLAPGNTAPPRKGTRTFATPTTLVACTYFPSGVAVFLHWLCFGTIELDCHLLEFRVYGVYECRLPNVQRPNAFSYHGATLWHRSAPKSSRFFPGWCYILPPNFMKIVSQGFKQQCLHIDSPHQKYSLLGRGNTQMNYH